MVEDQEQLKPYVVFAEGAFALLKDIIPDIKKKDVNGTERVYNIFYLKPLAKLRIKYKITEKDETFQNSGPYMGFYKKYFLKEYCKPLDLSPRSAVWVLYSDWNGVFIDMFGGEHKRLFDKLNKIEKENIGLRKSFNSLQYEFLKMSKNPLIYTQKLAERMNAILKTSTIVVGGENKERQEEEYGR